MFRFRKHRMVEFRVFLFNAYWAESCATKLYYESVIEFIKKMKIAVIGSGYVGLVTGTCLAETGNDVICVDIDKVKVDKIEKELFQFMNHT